MGLKNSLLFFLEKGNILENFFQEENILAKLRKASLRKNGNFSWLFGMTHFPEQKNDAILQKNSYIRNLEKKLNKFFM